MKKLLLLLLLPLAAFSQQIPVKRVYVLPTHCSPSNVQQSLVWKITATVGLYQCSATDTWTAVSGGTFAGGAVASAATFANGSAGTPSISFTNSATTGFFRSAADAIGVSTAGTERWTFNASGALNPLVSNSYDIGGTTTIRDIGIGRKAIFSGSTSGTTNLLATAIAGSTTLTLPAATDTLVGKATTDTFTNKTLTNPAVVTQTLTDQATIAWDASLGSVATVTLGSSRTMGAPTNLKTGGSYALRVIQGGAGSLTVTWDSTFKWPSATAPTLSTTVGRVDLVTCISYDGTNLLCNALLDVR